MTLRELLKQRRGSLATLAGQLGVSASLVTQWAAGFKPVTIAHCARIEMATEGRVACEGIRPDLEWVRVPDPAWPWHPEGRPLLDMGSAALTPAQEARDAA